MKKTKRILRLLMLAVLVLAVMAPAAVADNEPALTEEQVELTEPVTNPLEEAEDSITQEPAEEIKEESKEDPSGEPGTVNENPAVDTQGESEEKSTEGSSEQSYISEDGEPEEKTAEESSQEPDAKSDEEPEIIAEPPAEETAKASPAPQIGVSEEYVDADESLLAYLYKELNSGISLFSNNYGEGLSGYLRALYDAQKELFIKLLDGTESSTISELNFSETGDEWTAEELGLDTFDVEDDTVIKSAILKKYGLDYKNLYSALYCDCPYEAFWKTNQYTYFWINYEFVDSQTKDTIRITPGNTVAFGFVADEQYRMNAEGVDNTCTVDVNKLARVNASYDNVQRIAAAHSTEDGETKLYSFADEVCSRVEYNYSALEQEQTTDFSPWNIISVFDDDPDTNPVCGGYSVAYQYLCEIGKLWEESISVYSVTGNLSFGTGAGPHMWNVVNMPNGNNYIVDLTNSDGGDTCNWKIFFNLPDSGDVKGTYYFGDMGYTYDAEMFSFYSEDMLELASSYYNAGKVLANGNCGAEGNNVTWTLTRDGKLSLTGSGSMADFEYVENPEGFKAPWDYYGDSVKTVEMGNGISRIGQGAFFNRKLTEITIPETVEAIGKFAFGVNNFTNLVIPASVTNIETGAFFKCDNLTDVTFNGDGPEMAVSAFAEDTATIHYNCGKDGWSFDFSLMNGNLTWDGGHKFDSQWGTDDNTHYHACTVCSGKFDTADHVSDGKSYGDDSNTWKICSACGAKFGVEPVTPAPVDPVTPSEPENPTEPVTPAAPAQPAQTYGYAPVQQPEIVGAEEQIRLTSGTGTVQLSVKPAVNGAAVKSVEWTSSSPEYATVSENGLVEAQKGVKVETEVTITAKITDANGNVFTKTVKLTVVPSETLLTISFPKSFAGIAAGTSLNNQSITIDVFEVSEFVLTIPEDSGDETNPVLWNSSDESLATVDPNASGTSVIVRLSGANGEVKITATAPDGTENTVTFNLVGSKNL